LSEERATSDAKRGDTVERETWRLFIAFPLPASWLAEIVEWQSSELADDERLRLVGRSNLHVTLAFLGQVPRRDTSSVVRALAESLACATRPLFAASEVTTTRSVAMILLEDRGEHGAAIYRELASRLERAGLFRPEKRPWRAHVTVARHRVGRRLKLRVVPPALEPWSPSEAAVIHSRLHETGARYEVVQSLPIGGSRE
jgi:2'-5' RNA ligase